MTITDDTIDRAILFADDNLIVLNKPAGLAVHPAPGAGPNMEEWLIRLTSKGIKPGLAHRLDRDTSGCLVLGRNPQALRRLGLLFSSGRIAKEYWAVVEGKPPHPEGRIALNIGRFRRDRLSLSRVDPAGSPAITHYRALGHSHDRTWLGLVPETGRTHQLRVHCAAIGCAIVADTFYGRPGHPGERLHLHARAISIPFCTNTHSISIIAPPPEQMRPALNACGWDINADEGSAWARNFLDGRAKKS